MSARPTLDDHLFGPGPKRILSLDGGGVRGMITLGMLRRLETAIRRRHGADVRLCDYFDLIGGTSTGAVIAGALALGYDVDGVVGIYRRLAPEVFQRPRWFSGVRSRFDAAAFETAVLRAIGDHLERQGLPREGAAGVTLGSPLLQTGLAVLAKRIDTGRVWALTNNRKAKYWDPSDDLWRPHFEARAGGPNTSFPNAAYSLAKVVQASASAPFFLDGVSIEIEPGRHGHFLDGAVSPFNNPSQELFLMATLRSHGPGWAPGQTSPYGFDWRPGEDRLLMLSLGTGVWRQTVDPKVFQRWFAARQAAHALMGMMDDASVHAVTWMQALSDGPRAEQVDGNLLDMVGLRIVDEPLLRFRRMNAQLEAPWLERLGFRTTDADLARLRDMTNATEANLDQLEAIGRAAGEALFHDDDLPAAFDLGGASGSA